MIHPFDPDERAAISAAIEPPRLVREPCGYCDDGKVIVRDGTPFPALALCGVCKGRGWIVTEGE